MAKNNETELKYEGYLVHRRVSDGLVNLTDMWKAAGQPMNKNPRDWKRLDKTQELFENLVLTTGILPIRIQAKRGKKFKTRYTISEIPGIIETIKHGRYPATYATSELAIDYAQTISVQFHQWTLTALKDRIEEEANPELAYNRGKDRAIKGWENQGKSDDWIQDRINSIENYKQHTNVLGSHGVGWQQQRNGFAECADAINVEILGGRSKKLKEVLGLIKKSQRLRDKLSRKQLTALSFAEALADDEIETNDLQGNQSCRQACSQAARRVVLAAQGSTIILGK
ncbi:MAG: KilA-N domain-containing protein [Nostoc sp.]|uniref:KilA-N domain-containing protein n=1 Tax=Nostoc sp. TaxID=1180 RepID=UPI002FF7EFD5